MGPATFGERVEWARRRIRGLTQAGLGQQIGVANTTVSRWERGVETNPSAGNVALAAKALRVNARWLLTGEGLPDEPGGSGPAPGMVRDGAADSIYRGPGPDPAEVARRVRDAMAILDRIAADLETIARVSGAARGESRHREMDALRGPSSTPPAGKAHTG